GGAGGGDGRAQRIDHHHHARPATEGTVVHAAVVALGVVARVPAMDGQQLALDRPPDHAEPGAAGHELGEQADHVHTHGQNSGSQSTVIMPDAKSMSRMKSGRTKGIMRSRPSGPSRTTTTSLAPVGNRCETVPRSTPSRFRTRRPSKS